MCYMVVLSTSSSEDLTKFNTELLKFESTLPGLQEEKELSYENKWFVGSKDGCSCAFRHLHTSAIELGFSDPIDWYPEEESDISGAKQFYSVVRGLVEKGFRVDCVDAWDNQEGKNSLNGTEVIDINFVQSTSFRFFESYRFEFVSQS